MFLLGGKDLVVNQKHGSKEVTTDIDVSGLSFLPEDSQVKGKAQNKPLPENEYSLIIKSSAKDHGVPENILYNLLHTESRFNPKAIGPKTKYGTAKGIAQFIDSTAQELGVDALDPNSAIPGAARYLKQNYDKFGSWDKAVAAYNAGPGNVRKYKGIPPFAETQEYVKKVMAGYEEQGTFDPDIYNLDLSYDSIEEDIAKEQHGGDLSQSKVPQLIAAPETEYSLIEQGIRKISNILGMESPLAKDKGISDRAKAQALVQLMATEEGIPISEFRESPEFVEKFAKGFTDMATLGIMPTMERAMTGKEEFASDSFEGYAGKGLGSFAGLLFGPAKVGEFITGPITSRIAVTKDMPRSLQILKQGLKEAIVLSPVIGASLIGEAGEEKTFGQAAKVVLDGLVDGGMTGAIFGTTRGLFPQEVRHRAARIVTGLVALNAQRAMQNPDSALWSRPVNEIVFDTAMDTFFMWKGLNGKDFSRYERLVKEVADNPNLTKAEQDRVIDRLGELKGKASREVNKDVNNKIKVKVVEQKKEDVVTDKPSYEFVSKSGNRYEKVGEKWFNKDGKVVENKFVVKAAEKGKVRLGEDGVIGITPTKETDNKIIKRSDKPSYEYTAKSGKKYRKIDEKWYNEDKDVIINSRLISIFENGKVEIKKNVDFREVDSEKTKKNLEVMDNYEEIKDLDGFVARVAAEVNGKLDGLDIDISRTKDVVENLSNDLKRYADGSEVPKGVFEGMEPKELEESRDYVNGLKKWVDDSLKEEGSEGITLASGIDPMPLIKGAGKGVKFAYDKLTGKGTEWFNEEVVPEPFSIKGRAKELNIKRVGNIGVANYDTNKFVNRIERNTTQEQREVMPFVIEKTDIPDELGRPDLQKVIVRDRKILEPLAHEVKAHFDAGWKKIKANLPNLSTRQIEDYVTHLWDVPRNKKAEATNWFTTQNRFIERRFIDTYKEGIERGYKPKYLDINEIIKVHDSITNRAIENVKYVKALMAMSEDGIPLMVRSDNAPLSYVEIDYPALTRRVKVRKGDAKKEKGFVKEIKVKVHPDLERPLKAVFEERFSHPVISAYEAMNGLMKKSALSFSLFHHGALGEVGIAQGIVGKTANLYFNPVKIYKGIIKGELDTFKNEGIARDAVQHTLQLGASADVPVGKIQGYLDTLAKSSREIPLAGKITKFIAKGNSVWDKALWSYLHDSLKLYGYETIVSKLDPNLSKEQLRQSKIEIAQFMNDTFGGQNWDLLGVTPKEIQMMTWGLLSADWTVSTTRQALAPTGLGRIYKDTVGLRQNMGSMFWLRAGLAFGIGMNLLNAVFREWDIKKNPQYYRDKDYSLVDKTMFGNTVGKKTYLFRGRYKDGSERYIRWGKQFRDFFELISDPLNKLGGKAAPVPQLVSEVFTGHSLSGFKNDDVYGKKGLDKAKGIFTSLSKSALPISVRRFLKEDVEFNTLDVVMQSTKGMSRYKAIDYFKKAVIEDDEQLLKEVYEGALRNNLPAFTLFGDGLAEAKTEITMELIKKVKGIEEVEAKLSLAERVGDRARYGRLLTRLYKEKADWESGIELLDAAVKRMEAYQIVEGEEEEEEVKITSPRLQ